ncbi:hypothetical protein DCAR_0209199 [Daucus carota subsp. sativus]|uniref:F-box domain-containing protein n=2 Tax=Daucus carota subsp. sativus TaxID=79200 RepID=A0AAF0WKC0_DAUCS|nr:hypothetical protein DCAR_0209199 [Daucus carota subsp. sativus]
MTCKMRKSSEKHKSVSVFQWVDLPKDPLTEVFKLCNPTDALMTLPLVCKYWGRIFLEPIICKQKDNCLNFMPLREKPFYEFFYQSEDKNTRAMRLMKLLVGVMHAFACDNQSDAVGNDVGVTPIIKIIFPHDLPLHERHFVYVAERCPQLKSIILPCARDVTGKGITRAMRFWTGMEEMTLALFCRRLQYDLQLFGTIKEIRKSCKNLHCLQLNGFDLNSKSADILVRSLKSLKLLCLSGAYIHKQGLQIFFSRYNELDKVKFLGCIFFTSEGRELVSEINIMRIQERRKTRWRTDKYPDDIGKLHTAEELVDLLWKW